MSKHPCHWPDCKRQVSHVDPFCLTHAIKIPRDLRIKIRLSYKIGQEKTKQYTPQFILALGQFKEWQSNYRGGKNV